MPDFGLNPANAAQRQSFSDMIKNIMKNPQRTANGTFNGQGPGNTRGPVTFNAIGDDVVVMTPEGNFVTILKDGMLNNPSVISAFTP